MTAEIIPVADIGVLGFLDGDYQGTLAGRLTDICVTVTSHGVVELESGTGAVLLESGYGKIALEA
jgi:hypothetical protein